MMVSLWFNVLPEGWQSYLSLLQYMCYFDRCHGFPLYLLTATWYCLRTIPCLSIIGFGVWPYTLVLRSKRCLPWTWSYTSRLWFDLDLHCVVIEFIDRLALHLAVIMKQLYELFWQYYRDLVLYRNLTKTNIEDYIHEILVTI